MYECVGDCTEWDCARACVRFSVNPTQQKKMEFVNTVYISDYISNMIPLF